MDVDEGWHWIGWLGEGIVTEEILGLSERWGFEGARGGGRGLSIGGIRNRGLFLRPGTVSCFQQPWSRGALFCLAEAKQEAQRG